MEYISVKELENAINIAIHQAIASATDDLVEKLKEYIKSEFYNQYQPVWYERTYQLVESATMRLIGTGMAEIYMDGNGRYSTGSKPSYSTIQEYASQGIHGFPQQGIQTSGRFWESFLDYVNANLETILKRHLKEVGIDVD